MRENELLYKSAKVNFAWQNIARHGELSFLHQWDSATSPKIRSNRLSSPFASPELRLAKFLAMAISVAKWPGALWKSSPFSSPLARHGELAFAQICCFCTCLMFGHSIPAQMGRVR
jgi:hypothetical protein